MGGVSGELPVGTKGAGRTALLVALSALALQVSSTPASASSAQGAVEQEPPTVSVTALGSVARTYEWSIAKESDASIRSTGTNGTAAFRHTVTARAGAATDSGWALRGTVSVTNPNPTSGGAVVADVTVATTLGGGSACTVAGGDDVVVPPAGAGPVVLPYTCDVHLGAGQQRDRRRDRRVGPAG